MSSSVFSWLDGVENRPPSCRSSRKRKAADSAVTRKRHCGSDVPPRGRGQRVPLNDAEQNILREARRSPRRRIGHASPAVTAEVDVVDAAPLLGPPSSSIRSQSIASSNPSRRSRSSSPRKTAGLIALPEPIAYVNLDPYDSDQRPPQQVQDMVDKIKDYMKGRKILSNDMRAEIEELDRLEEFDESCFDASDTRKAIGTAPSFTRVVEIRDETQVCCNTERGVNEAGFNCESHHPIGKLAWRNSIHKSSLRWENITTADITPRSALLPTSIAAPAPDSARVDFAIVLEPSAKMKAALPYLESLSDKDVASWGPTTMTAVARRPFASVVETKKSGGDVAHAEYQIGIWAYAIFKRLRLLLQDNGHSDQQLPCIPLLIADGEKWEIRLAVQDAKHATEIWKIGDIGNACSCKGIYQIVAILQVIYDDAQTNLRPWFEAYCLPEVRSGHGRLPKR